MGLLLPWTVGIGVKLYLDAHSKPTLPWSYFLNVGSLLLFIPLSFWFAVPYLGLIYFARRILPGPWRGLQSARARVLVVVAGLLGGCIGTVFTFMKVFWEFDPLYFFIPLLWIYYVPPMVGGVLVGFWIAKILDKSVVRGAD